MEYHEPWSVEFGEYAGYDCMSSVYWIKDVAGKVLFEVDCGDFPPDEPPSYINCGPSAAAQAVADRIVACVNAARSIPQAHVLEEAKRQSPRFRFCARSDCPKHRPGTVPFELTSHRKRRYCTQYCAHLESMRRLRATRKRR